MCIARIKYCLLFTLYLLSAGLAVAQDAHFTQQYANRLYLNPAFSGLGRDWSVAVAHRNQWPSLNGSFVTNQFSADYRFGETKSAIGVVLQQDRAGIGGLQKLQASLAYGYHTRFTDNLAFSAGLQTTIASLRVNYNNLVFGDQLSDYGQTALTSAEANQFDPTSYVSFAVGSILYNNNFWAGLNVLHLNQPSYGFDETTQLPLRFVANAGYKFYLSTGLTRNNAEFSISPALNFTHQQNFNRVDFALYTIYSPLALGVIYKGVPVTGADQDQSLGIIAGVSLSRLRIGFSHDVGVKGFGRQAGGANEISLVFEQLNLNNLFTPRRLSKINHNIVCPAF
ncbi:PorP/SprF family type IX secretion system membrane protein [Pontibacter sp. HSC-14F20]|uniref:PorP/SprF family type IX secretion system membrane protein n=1 Tax=Pontibacter sp. HSC-14F20 TaxID=2864136 RepID=UPI001C733DB7|nr:PorP/SprF family type IX secretion system membrane protein [Pontibacter sp. HSC-14F20]MBX0333683.1 PorP/SprF family type IX secretion system membrane protein [Pontibacter sp. HSC-14F20]